MSFSPEQARVLERIRDLYNLYGKDINGMAAMTLYLASSNAEISTSDPRLPHLRIR